MNAIDFCFWLQGYFEISGDEHIDQKKMKIIKDHLALAFVHEIDEKRELETSASKHALDSAHNGNDIKMRC